MSNYGPAISVLRYSSYLDYSKKITRDDLFCVDTELAATLSYGELQSKYFPGRVLTLTEYKFYLFDSVIVKVLDWFGSDGSEYSGLDLTSKGELVHKLFSENIVQKSPFAEYLGSLLTDPVLYAYAFFRYNNCPVQCYPYQDAILNDPHKRIDVELSNQIGKSFGLAVLAAVLFNKDHGKNIYIGLISKSKTQNSINQDAVRQFLQSTPFDLEDMEKDNSIIMTRNIYAYNPDGSAKLDSSGKRIVLYKIRLVCGVAGTSSLGFPFDYLFPDEFEFWENPEGLQYLYDQVFKPRTFHTKGQIIIHSNPNGKNFVSEDLQERMMTREYAIEQGYARTVIEQLFAQSDECREFHVYNFNFLDKPGNTKSMWEHEKKHTHPIIFASTMAALRTDNVAAAISESQIRDSRSKYLADAGTHAGKGKRCVFFLDVGHVHDQSVLTGVYLDKTTDKNTDEVKVEVHEFYKHYYPVTYPLWRIIGIDPERVKDHAINVNDGWDDRVADNPSIKDVLAEYSYDGSQPVFGADLTGNEAMYPLLNVAGVYCEPVKMSGPWKAKWYGYLISLLAQRRYKRGIDENWQGRQNKNWESQARTLQITTKKSDGAKRGYALYHHETEADLDDALDSSVGALSLLDDELDYSPSAIVIQGDTETDLNKKDNNTSEVDEDIDPEFKDLMEREAMFRFWS